MQTCTNENLLRAALENRTNAVRHLLRAGADPRFRNDLPLSVAAKLGHIEIVRELLNAGANPSRQTGAAGSPLHWSCAEGRMPVVRLMLSKGADPNALAETGQTPLHWACERKQSQVVRALLAAGANPNIVDQRRLSPLHCACRQGSDDIVSMLLAAGAQSNLVATSGQTPLQWAAAAGADECIRLLLRAGALPAKADVRGRTPLHFSSEHGRLSATQLLLAAGVSPSTIDQQGSTPLHAAVFEGHPSVVKALIDVVADVNQVGNDGMPPLVLCAISSRPHDSPTVARLLLAAGARPNAVETNQRKRSPLSIAVTSSNIVLAKELIAGGADPNERCGFGAVVRRNNTELATVLLRGGMNPDYDATLDDSFPLLVACAELLPDMVSALLHHGANPDKRDIAGFTSLGFLISLASTPRSAYAKPEFLAVVATLIKAGASLEEAYPETYRHAFDAAPCLQGIAKDICRRQRAPLPSGKEFLPALVRKYARTAPMQKL